MRDNYLDRKYMMLQKEPRISSVGKTRMNIPHSKISNNFIVKYMQNISPFAIIFNAQSGLWRAIYICILPY